MWGAEDLIASIGGLASRTADGTYLDIAIHTRSVILLAAAASGKSAIDAVYLDIEDDNGLTQEASSRGAFGLHRKGLHPPDPSTSRPPGERPQRGRTRIEGHPSSRRSRR